MVGWRLVPTPAAEHAEASRSPRPAPREPRMEITALLALAALAILAVRHFVHRPSVTSGAIALGAVLRLYGALS